MIVAAAAYQQLTPATRTKVDQLLRLNPQYNEWIANIAAADRSEVAFLLAATWPDFIKHQPDYVNDGDLPDGPDAARNIGYTDRAQHRYWHFINSAFSPDGTVAPAVPTPNITTQIGAFRKVLSSPSASADLKSYDLVWLLHLVGDLHQPLHATSRYTKRMPRGDRGGNSVALCRFPCKDDMHGFWDGALGQCHSPFAARSIARSLLEAPTTATAIVDEAQWQDESRRLAQTVVYAPVAVDAVSITLDDAYRRNAQRIARERAALAGARLAKLLSSELH